MEESFTTMEKLEPRESFNNDRVDQLFENEPDKLEIDGLKSILDRQSRELSFYQKQTQLESEKQVYPEIVTIEKMQSDVKQIFVKIVEQLDDPLHPLFRICKEF